MTNAVKIYSCFFHELFLSLIHRDLHIIIDVFVELRIKIKSGKSHAKPEYLVPDQEVKSLCKTLFLYQLLGID